MAIAVGEWGLTWLSFENVFGQAIMRLVQADRNCILLLLVPVLLVLLRRLLISLLIP